MKTIVHIFTTVTFLATQLSTCFAFAQETKTPVIVLSEKEQIEILQKASNSDHELLNKWDLQLNNWYAQDLKLNFKNGPNSDLSALALIGFKRQALEMGMEAMARYSVADQGLSFCQNSKLTDVISKVRAQFPGLNEQFESQCEEFKKIDMATAAKSLSEVIATAGIVVNQIEDQLFRLEGARLIALGQGKRSNMDQSKAINDQIRELELQIAQQNLELDKVLSGDPLLMLLSTHMKIEGDLSITLADFIRVQQRKFGKSLPGQDQLTPLISAVAEKLPALMAQARVGVESFMAQAAEGDYEFFLAFPTLRAKAFDKMATLQEGLGEALLANDKMIASQTHFNDAGPAAPNPIEYLYTTGAMVAGEAVPQAALLIASKLNEAKKVVRMEKIEALSRPWAIASVGAVLLYVGGKAALRIKKVSDYQKMTALGAFVGANSFETARQAQLRKVAPLVMQATIEMVIATVVKMKFRSTMTGIRAMAESPKGFTEFLTKVKNLGTAQFWKKSTINAFKLVASKNTYNAVVNVSASLSMLSVLGMQARGNHSFTDLMFNDAGFRTNFWITAACDALLGYYGGTGSAWDVAFVLGSASALASVLGQKKAGVPVSWDRVAFDAAFTASLSTIKYRLLYTPTRNFVNNKIMWVAGGDNKLAKTTIVASDLVLAFANNGVGNGLYDWTVRTQLEPDKDLRVSILSSTANKALGPNALEVTIKASELEDTIPGHLPLPLEVVKGSTSLTPN